jgi:RimJ/RimL family protein N-acetyltransferase
LARTCSTSLPAADERPLQTSFILSGAAANTVQFSGSALPSLGATPMKSPSIPNNVRFMPIETERLILRRFAPADWRAVHRYMSDQRVTAFLPEGLMSPARARAYAARNAKKPHAIAVIEKTSEQLIGHMAFHPWFAPATWEVGWALARDRQGLGYATEAASALLSYAFGALGCHRVIATCQPQNPASWRVAEKLRMRREGHFKAGLAQPGGEWWDEYFYAILTEEFAGL